MKDINRLVLLQTHPISLSISTWVHVHKSFLPCPFFELQEAALSKDMKVESPTLSQVETESHQNMTCQLVSACVASTFAIQSYCSINHFRNAMSAAKQSRTLHRIKDCWIERSWKDANSRVDFQSRQLFAGLALEKGLHWVGVNIWKRPTKELFQLSSVKSQSENWLLVQY
jgi:hypothetical protein